MYKGKTICSCMYGRGHIFCCNFKGKIYIYLNGKYLDRIGCYRKKGAQQKRRNRNVTKNKWKMCESKNNDDKLKGCSEKFSQWFYVTKVMGTKNTINKFG